MATGTENWIPLNERQTVFATISYNSIRYHHVNCISSKTMKVQAKYEDCTMGKELYTVVTVSTVIVNQTICGKTNLLFNF